MSDLKIVKIKKKTLLAQKCDFSLKKKLAGRLYMTKWYITKGHKETSAFLK